MIPRIEPRMALDKPSDSRKSSSRGLVIVIAIVILLALSYTIFRTIEAPKHHSDQTTQPKN
jgi:hypothetical protein